MTEGIEITCVKRGLLWLSKPYCLVNLVEKKTLVWGEKQFIPLLPNMSYRIRIAHSFWDGIPRMPVTITVSVREGEIQEYTYSTEMFPTQYSVGKMKRTKPPCATCNSPLTLIMETQDWYCNQCKTYPQVHQTNGNSPSDQTSR